MSETIDILQHDVDAIDVLDDDAFRDMVEKRIDPVPDNKPIWKILCHPTLVERASGCLEEIAEELHDAVTRRGVGSGHFKAKRLAVVNARLEQVSAAMTRADDHMSQMSRKNREADELQVLVRQLTLAIDTHRLECIRQELSPEPHDVALWDLLDALTLPAHDCDRGPTLAEQIAAGHWWHPSEPAGRVSPSVEEGGRG